LGKPEKIIVFSRDEAKQHYMRLEYLHRRAVTEEIIYENFQKWLTFRIGDVRSFSSVLAALREADIVFNAAALKQVPTCEYFPSEAVQTNVLGPENVVRAIREHQLPIETVVGISTDKACKPVNVMGMTKAIQERLFIRANLDCPGTRFICARYGNVLASRGSVIPLFHEQILQGGPVTITTPSMTRFLLSLEDAVDTVLSALGSADRGQIYIPRIPSARVLDIAEVLIGSRPIEIAVTGIRPGEKIHEILVSEEECHRTYGQGAYYVINPILPELRGIDHKTAPLGAEYSSADSLMNQAQLRELLDRNRLLNVDGTTFPGEDLD
jgi:UDP-glucose 4-epimerase